MRSRVDADAWVKLGEQAVILDPVAIAAKFLLVPVEGND